jgi:cysteinyl-tRNA synthetase
MKTLTTISLFLIGITLSFAQDLSNANTWAYQLQDINISAIAANNTFDLIVMDYSQDGTDAEKFTQVQIQQIKESGKLAICYISIGEAEDYRYYWQTSWSTTPPVWLGAENPDWAGNYKVKYWETEWQSIVFDYVDTIIAQGFDGIYLDIIDAYYYWTEEVSASEQEPYADTLMVDFVYKLRQHIDAITSNPFYIIPQNGSFVVDDANGSAALRAKYFSAIDAIGVEDVFFYGDLDMNNVYNPDNDRIAILTDYLNAGKKVFSIEYLSDQPKIDQYVNVAGTNGFIPYVCVRDLNQLCDGIDVSVNEIVKNDEINIYSKANVVYVNSSKIIEYYSVYNLNGQLIKEDGYNSKTFQIQLEPNYEGVVIIEFGDDTFEIRKKVVITKN